MAHLVAQHEEGHVRERVVREQPVELLLGLVEALAVRGVDEEDDDVHLMCHAVVAVAVEAGEQCDQRAGMQVLMARGAMRTVRAARTAMHPHTYRA